MNKIKLIFSITFLLIASSASSNEIEDGKALHNESCISCHMMESHTALYTREKRRVNDKHGLGGMVSMCTQQLNIDWFPEEEKSVVEFLNHEFYKFK